MVSCCNFFLVLRKNQKEEKKQSIRRKEKGRKPRMIQTKIMRRLKVEISKAEGDVYAAIIDDKLAMKIGPGHYEPESGPHKWSLAAEGNNYNLQGLGRFINT